MLDYRLDDETETLRKTVREFAQEVIAPQIGEFYERDEFPTAIVRQMGELGLFGLPFPEEYGGAGGTYFDLCVALEELARVDSSMAITVEAGVSLGGVPIFRFGTEAPKQECRRRLGRGPPPHPPPAGGRSRGDKGVEGVHHNPRPGPPPAGQGPRRHRHP